MYGIRLTWVLGTLLFPSGLQSISAQNAPPAPPFGGPPPIYDSLMAGPAITASASDLAE